MAGSKVGQFWRKLWLRLRRGLRWLSENPIRMVGWLALPALVWGLVEKRDELTLGQQLVLLLAILAAAAVAQLSGDLLPRLKKVGPIEFFGREVRDVLEPLRRFFPAGTRTKAGEPLTLEDQYKYRKADMFLWTLEFSGVTETDLARNEEFHDLLFKIGSIAATQKDWPRAAERFEQLLRVSDGQYEGGKVYYNAGVNYLLWASDSEGEEREQLYQRALRRLEQAVSKDANNYLAFYNLAWLQDELGMYKRAIKNNDLALEIWPRSAQAKYNGAILSAKLGDLQEAFRRLSGISPEDEQVEETIRGARDDGELKLLVDSPQWGPKVAAWLEPFGERDEDA